MKFIKVYDIETIVKKTHTVAKTKIKVLYNAYFEEILLFVKKA